MSLEKAKDNLLKNYAKVKYHSDFIDNELLYLPTYDYEDYLFDKEVEKESELIYKRYNQSSHLKEVTKDALKAALICFCVVSVPTSLIFLVIY